MTVLIVKSRRFTAGENGCVYLEPDEYELPLVKDELEARKELQSGYYNVVRFIKKGKCRYYGVVGRKIVEVFPFGHFGNFWFFRALKKTILK